jgi:hypothetical protein
MPPNENGDPTCFDTPVHRIANAVQVTITVNSQPTIFSRLADVGIASFGPVTKVAMASPDLN